MVKALISFYKVNYMDLQLKLYYKNSGRPLKWYVTFFSKHQKKIVILVGEISLKLGKNELIKVGSCRIL